MGNPPNKQKNFLSPKRIGEKEMLLSCPFYRQENWGKEKYCDLLNVTYLVNDRYGIWVQPALRLLNSTVYCKPSPSLFSTCCMYTLIFLALIFCWWIFLIYIMFSGKEAARFYKLWYQLSKPQLEGSLALYMTVDITENDNDMLRGVMRKDKLD